MSRVRVVRLVTAYLGTLVVASATPIAVGFLSFDRDSPTGGENSISVNNFTGTDSGLGCGQVDPGLPVCDALSFAGSLHIIYQTDAGVFTTDLPLGGPIGPGTTTPAGATFAGTTTILATVLNGMISPTTFLLFNNQIFAAGPDIISQTLAPGSQPGPGDIALLTVDVPVTTVPEPATISAIFLGFIIFGLVVRFRKTKSARQA